MKILLKKCFCKVIEESSYVTYELEVAILGGVSFRKLTSSGGSGGGGSPPRENFFDFALVFLHFPYQNHPHPDGGARAAVTCKPSVPAAALHLSVAQGGGGALVGSQKTAGQREDYENGLCDNSARELAEALKTNTALTTLNLRDNSIGDEGAVALAEALKVRT